MNRYAIAVRTETLSGERPFVVLERSTDFPQEPVETFVMLCTFDRYEHAAQFIHGMEEAEGKMLRELHVKG